MQLIGQNHITERQLYLSELQQLDEFPRTLQLPSRYFGLFLVCDGRIISDQRVLDFAHALLEHGLAFAGFWGPECERIHDLFDSAAFEVNPNVTEGSVLMTSWFSKVNLDDAIWSFLYASPPADDYWEECRSEIVVVVGNHQWASQVRSRLLDQAGLNKAVLGENSATT